MQTELEAPFYSHASVFTGFPVTRSISDDFEESKDIFTSIESFEEKEYIPELSRYTKFFSTSSVFQLVSTLFDFGSKQAKSTSISNNELQVKLQFADINDENIDIIVNILKYGKKHCIEVSLDSGDSFEFKRIYSKLLAFFGGHANAQEIDELNQSGD